MKKLLILFVFVISLFAENIDKYKVNMIVSDKGQLFVQENITYNFSPNRKHGIFRNIPTLRGKPEHIVVLMDNHFVNTKILTKNNHNDLIIRIGSADKFVTGIHNYKINYTMDKVTREYNQTHNTIRFNAVGTEWQVPISHIVVDVRLPKILANTTINTFSGSYGSTKTTARVEKLSDTHYRITLQHLFTHQGLTFGIYFDKNLIPAYHNPKTAHSDSFINRHLNQKPDNRWVWFFLMVFSIGSYLYYKKHIVHLGAIVPQYYPPENLDILQSGVLIDEEFDDKDITAGILELAVKGYLKIETHKEGIIFKDKITSITKLESDKKLTPFLQSLYSRLFKGREILTLGEKDENLAGFLRNSIEKLKDKTFNWAVKEKYFSETPSSAKAKFFFMNFLVALPFIVFSGYQTFQIASDNMFSMMMFFIMDMLFLIVALLFIKQLVMKLIFIAIPLVQLVLLSSDMLPIFKYSFPLSLLSLIPIIFFTKKIDVYTPKGAKVLQYLLGFKDFIQKVESNKIKLLLEKDPEYLDKVLPYAVLFGVSEHWLKLYEELNQNIYWYEGDRNSFYSLNNDLYDSFETTKSYTKNESSSSDFGGSDSSGGGSGGGGGGSW